MFLGNKFITTKKTHFRNIFQYVRNSVYLNYKFKLLIFAWKNGHFKIINPLNSVDTRRGFQKFFDFFF